MTDILSNSNNSNPYGLRAIREIRGSKDKSKVPSERLTKKINDTHNYFYEKVDPIIGECITYLLCERPTDVAASMLDYLKKKKEGTITSKDLQDSSKTKSKAKKELKLYLAVSIGPVIAKIVNRIAVTQPENVIDFVSEELVSMISSADYTSEGAITAAQSNNNGTSSEEVKQSVSVPAAAAGSDTPVAEIKAVKEKRQFQVQVIGCGGAGKSSIISSVQGQFEAILRIKPTSGLRPSTAALDESTTVKFYDLGGSSKFRSIWPSYSYDAYGVIYVVDASASQDIMAESKEWLHKTLSDDNLILAGKPVLILANKQDVEGAISAEALSLFFEVDMLKASREVLCCECSAYVPPDFDETFTGDPRIEASMEQLFNIILANYQDLHSKVNQDVVDKEKVDIQKRVEKEAKVLKNKIASAFFPEIDPAISSLLNIIVDEKDNYSKEDGDIFLASEVGEEMANLSECALAVAKGAGYQRLALQMLGAMRAPISKKKTPMSWEEILVVVLRIRGELGLPEF